MSRVPIKEITIEATQKALDDARESLKNDGYMITSIDQDEKADGTKIYRIEAKDLSAVNRPGLEIID